eukprot:4195816-Prymnesium_polylepis.2
MPFSASCSWTRDRCMPIDVNSLLVASTVHGCSDPTAFSFSTGSVELLEVGVVAHELRDDHARHNVELAPGKVALRIKVKRAPANLATLKLEALQSIRFAKRGSEIADIARPLWRFVHRRVAQRVGREVEARDRGILRECNGEVLGGVDGEVAVAQSAKEEHRRAGFKRLAAQVEQRIVRLSIPRRVEDITRDLTELAATSIREQEASQFTSDAQQWHRRARKLSLHHPLGFTFFASLGEVNKRFRLQSVELLDRQGADNILLFVGLALHDPQVLQRAVVSQCLRVSATRQSEKGMCGMVCSARELTQSTVIVERQKRENGIRSKQTGQQHKLIHGGERLQVERVRAAHTLRQAVHVAVAQLAPHTREQCLAKLLALLFLDDTLLLTARPKQIEGCERRIVAQKPGKHTCIVSLP